MTKVIPFLFGPFSQWHKKAIIVDNVTYNCCEQYMMAEKARLFNDHRALKQIMATSDPRKQKKLGRSVKKFRNKIWKKHMRNIVYKANYAKFTQHDDMKTKLVETGSAVLCEANPSDKIWGVGLSAHDPDVHYPERWKGRNLLGEILMEVRVAIGGEKPLYDESEEGSDGESDEESEGETDSDDSFDRGMRKIQLHAHVRKEDKRARGRKVKREKWKAKII